jgi:hypothetical protein
MLQGNINREFRVLANLPSLPDCNWIVAGIHFGFLLRMYRV